jgi:hypothetical protein
MKFFAILAALCCLSACSAQGLDFITDNILNPLVNDIYNNAINLLGQQLGSLLGSLFGPIGKRGLSDVLNVNIAEVLAPFIAQVKEIYQRVFAVFLQIVHNVEAWIEKPDWARIEFVRAGIEAEAQAAKLTLSVKFLQPLIDLVQKHLGALITDFQGIIAQVLDAAKHPIQSLIGTGNLLQP